MCILQVVVAVILSYARLETTVPRGEWSSAANRERETKADLLHCYSWKVLTHIGVINVNYLLRTSQYFEEYIEITAIFSAHKEAFFLISR